MGEGAEVCAAEGFWGDADFEGGFVKPGHGEASAVHADAVAEGTVSEDFGGVGDGEGCPIFGSRKLGDDLRC